MSRRPGPSQGTGRGTARDAVRLALGTLTVVPVPAPSRVDRATAGAAMALAPLAGLLLGLLPAVPLWLAGDTAPPLLTAVLSVALLAAATRALHLDGLADTADGLGSGRAGADALEIMRRSDIGPFGVVTLLLVLLSQVAALERLIASPGGPATLVVAVVVSRTTLPLLCSDGVPAGRADGLGAGVAGSVTRPRLALALALAAAVIVSVWVLGGAGGAVRLVLLVAVPLLLTGLFARHAVRRFGGVTGDVLGACVELSLAAALVVAAL